MIEVAIVLFALLVLVWALLELKLVLMRRRCLRLQAALVEDRVHLLSEMSLPPEAKSQIMSALLAWDQEERERISKMGKARS
jgi:hypothetical protein